MHLPVPVTTCSLLLSLAVALAGCSHPSCHQRSCHRGSRQCAPDGYDPGHATCPLSHPLAGVRAAQAEQLAAVPGRFHPVPTRPVFGVDPSVGRPIEELPREEFKAPRTAPTPEQQLRMLPDPDAAAAQQKKLEDGLRDENTPYGGNFLPGEIVP